MSATFAQIETNVPHEDGQIPSAGHEYASGDSSQSKSPLHGFSFFKGLSSEKKLKADGQPPKRRGPKPDSKPALTRRQELNRQAQRTHRERKELYIKALEQEVLHLKEQFGSTARERDAFAEENKNLKELLAAHGIQYIKTHNEPSSTESYSGSYPAPSNSSHSSPPPASSSAAAQAGRVGQDIGPQQQPVGNLDYDQIGIDFVLSLERPCMDHMQMLCVKSQSSEAEISGHALMATCPPQSHLIERPDVPYPHQMPDIEANDLLRLLDLSNRLPLEGEITPVMAWASILRHEHCKLLAAPEFSVMKDELLAKVRCYGFGAVLEEFEVEDAIQGALARRSENQVGVPSAGAQGQAIL